MASKAKGKAKAKAAQVVEPTPVAPKVRKGTSTVKQPVAVTWVTCINLTAANGGELLARKQYTLAAREAGVTYYTARTQVHRYLQWHAAGQQPAGLPRGVKLG